MVIKRLIGVIVGLGVFLIVYMFSSLSLLIAPYLYISAVLTNLGWFVSAESLLAVVAIGIGAIVAAFVAQGKGVVLGIIVLVLSIGVNHLLSLGITFEWPSTGAVAVSLWVLYVAAAVAGGIFGEHLAGRNIRHDEKAAAALDAKA